MSEPIFTLIRRTEAALRAEAARFRSNGDAFSVATAVELERRADGCCGWEAEAASVDFPAERESIIRSTCASWLRMMSQ